MQSPSVKGSETISKRSPYIFTCMDALNPKSLIFEQLSELIPILSTITVVTACSYGAELLLQFAGCTPSFSHVEQCRQREDHKDGHGESNQSRIHLICAHRTSTQSGRLLDGKK
jgi:hypothetical protein